MSRTFSAFQPRASNPEIRPTETSQRFMAYRFKIDESLEKGVRRIAVEQIRRAAPHLDGTGIAPESVHGVRKTTKRLRALLRAVRPALSQKEFRARYDAIGEVAGLLSVARQHHVTFETISKLQSEFGADATDAMVRLTERLRQGAPDCNGAMPPGVAERAAYILKREEKKFAEISLTGRGLTKFFDGVEHIYRRGQRAFQDAYETPSDEVFHAMRKAVQWHWRHMALMSRCWPEYFDMRIAAGRELAQILGDEHDLSVLRAIAIGHGTELGDAFEKIGAMIASRQDELRAAAHPRAARLFAEKPGAFRQRVEAYWAAGRKIMPLQHLPQSAEIEKPASALSGQPGSSAPRLASKTPRRTPSQEPV